MRREPNELEVTLLQFAYILVTLFGKIISIVPVFGIKLVVVNEIINYALYFFRFKILVDPTVESELNII